jgi:hypothetical protein
VTEVRGGRRLMSMEKEGKWRAGIIGSWAE